MDYHYDGKVSYECDSPIAFFPSDNAIKNGKIQRVAKDFDCDLKGEPVFFAILLVLGLIPLESYACHRIRRAILLVNTLLYIPATREGIAEISRKPKSIPRDLVSFVLTPRSGFKSSPTTAVLCARDRHERDASRREGLLACAGFLSGELRHVVVRA